MIEADAEGHRIAGTAVFALGGAPYDIRYTVIADPRWHTRVVAAHVQGPERDRRLALRADGNGNWWMADQPLPELSGCLDVDLAFTPATASLPVLRLSLAEGEKSTSPAAHVGFPEDRLSRVEQVLARVAPDRYRATRGEATVDLTVDAQNIVLEYADRWRAVGSA